MDLKHILFAFRNNFILFRAVNHHNHLKINNTCIVITLNITWKAETYGEQVQHMLTTKMEGGDWKWPEKKVRSKD